MIESVASIFKGVSVNILRNVKDPKKILKKFITTQGMLCIVIFN